MADEKRIIGWVEPVTILDGESSLKFAAKIDSGADYSSIDIESLNVLSREGETWIRFELEDDSGQQKTLERPLYKMTRVKRKGTESQPRFVVMLEMCLGGTLRTTRFSLVDRHNYKYRLLIGRDFLRSQFIIDPELRNTTAKACPEQNE
ncbi:MAG: RimK/LysX family protein [Pseudomonadota bacterium]|nr:RimK/LysX family protein [Pseudomonadota bacterium]